MKRTWHSSQEATAITQAGGERAEMSLPPSSAQSCSWQHPSLLQRDLQLRPRLATVLIRLDHKCPPALLPFTQHQLPASHLPPPESLQSGACPFLDDTPIARSPLKDKNSDGWGEREGGREKAFTAEHIFPKWDLLNSFIR